MAKRRAASAACASLLPILAGCLTVVPDDSMQSSSATRDVELPRSELAPSVHPDLLPPFPPAGGGEEDGGTTSDGRGRGLYGTKQAHSQSPLHSQLRTGYGGTVASSSVELSVSNRDRDGRSAVFSSLGLNVRGDVGPCRVRLHARRADTGSRLGDAGGAGTASSGGAGGGYDLVLDTSDAICRGEGVETLVPSEMFLNYWTEVLADGYSEAVNDASPADEDPDAAAADVPLGDMTLEDPSSGLTTYSVEAPPPEVDVHHGLTDLEKGYPLLVGVNETLSLFVTVGPVDDGSGRRYQLLSSKGKGGPSKSDGGSGLATDDLVFAKANQDLDLYEGSSVVEGDVEDFASGEELDLEVVSPTVFDGALYYDLIDPDATSLRDYYDHLRYALLPGGGPLDTPGCAASHDTGYVDTIGSFGLMFDLSNALTGGDINGDGVVSFPETFQDIEVYSLDVYIRNLVAVDVEVYVRNDGDAQNEEFVSYLTGGAAKIKTAWERVAKGVVTGLGPGVGTPVPKELWTKTIRIRPGQTVGVYVTVKDAPDLRYRNSSLPEGGIYSTDGVLNVHVGRSWGEYPLRGDGSDVYFAPREYTGAFHYVAQDGACGSAAPSAMPSAASLPGGTESPTGEIRNAYEHTRDDGMCPEEAELISTFNDGTGSHGALFDVAAKTTLTLTGIDLNVDWHSSDVMEVLVYARLGSWFSHQNDADAWPYKLVDTVLRKPDGFRDSSTGALPVSAKLGSARIPRSAFKPLSMKAGETWSIYVCTSVADFRYTLGTSIGKTFASNSELKIMEGAGAADWPPFGGGDASTGGIEYTFYAPRVFNGRLRYDYVDECPSEAPSVPGETSAPTASPRSVTRVSYTFYIEHSPDILAQQIKYDMSFGVRKILEEFVGGKDELLSGYASFHDLEIDSVLANVVLPSQIGYLCIPTPPQLCTPVSIDVTVSHSNTVSVEDVTYSLLRHSTNLPNLIKAEGYTAEYVGERTVETDSRITLSGVPDRLMGESEQEYFAKVAQRFLAQNARDSENDSLTILSVTVNDQEFTNSVQYQIGIRDNAVRGRERRRRLEKATNIDIKVKGKFTPPPQIDFGSIVEDSINRDSRKLQEELKKPSLADRGGTNVLGEASPVGGLGYFEEVIVEEAKELKRPPLVTVVMDDTGGSALLNYAAMGCGGLIAALAAAFFLRPRRRRAMFGGKGNADEFQYTQPLNVESGGGGVGDSFALSNSGGLSDSDIKIKQKSMRGGWSDNEPARYDPRASTRSGHSGRSGNSGPSRGSRPGY